MTQRIFLIRHGEKPTDDGTIAGVSETGEQDPEELSVKGWQRAGALVRLFAAPAFRPDFIFASKIGPHSNSLRPQHTVLPLANFLKKTLELPFEQGEEEGLAAELVTRVGTTLVAWEHKIIPQGIANRILGTDTLSPQKWHGDRFDLIWVFERETPQDAWTFTQVPQMLLSGDRADVFPIP